MVYIDKHIDNIKAGDTIIHNEKLVTVCRSDIKHCRFMGTSIFGDTYKLGRDPVKYVPIANIAQALKDY